MSDLISFSLYGSNPLYCEGIVRNVIDAAVIYPGWQVVVFHDEKVPPEVLGRIRDGGGRVVRMRGKISKMGHRMVAMTLRDVDRVVFRDADSRLSWREKEAVDEWIGTGLRFHTMRDHPKHKSAIMGGMWGACGGAIPNFRTILGRFPWKGIYGEDERFLEKDIWSKYKDEFFVHDSHGSGPGRIAIPFPSCRIGKRFVGEAIAPDGEPFREHWRAITAP